MRACLHRRPTCTFSPARCGVLFLFFPFFSACGCALLVAFLLHTLRVSLPPPSGAASIPSRCAGGPVCPAWPPPVDRSMFPVVVLYKSSGKRPSFYSPRSPPLAADNALIRSRHARSQHTHTQTKKQKHMARQTRQSRVLDRRRCAVSHVGARTCCHGDASPHALTRHPHRRHRCRRQSWQSAAGSRAQRARACSRASRLHTARFE